MKTPNVEIYSKSGCSLCKEAKKIVGKVRSDIPFNCKEVDISLDEDLKRRFNDHVPMIYINGKKVFKFKVDESEFRKRIRKEIIKSGILRVLAGSERKTNPSANRRFPVR